MKIDLTPPSPSRIFITGTTGSGKTTLAKKILSKAPGPLVFIDSKYDPENEMWAKKNGIKIVKKMPDWRTIKKDVMIRPPEDWLEYPKDIGWWCGKAFDCKYVPTLYIDEGYLSGASQNDMSSGLVKLWTQGRAFGFRTIIASQRPAWINRFILTESDTYYVGWLKDKRDRKALADALGEPDLLEPAPQHWFYRLKAGEKIQLLKPLDIEKEKGYNRSKAKIYSVKRKTESIFSKLFGGIDD